jgi:thiol:disulfide interchange protein DsbA
MSEKISRRTVLAAALGLTTARGAGAQDRPSSGEIKPYLEVPPVAGDESVVRVFFSPNCAYSRQYFQFFKNLETSLPKNRQFVFSPLVNRGDGVTYALAFEAVRLADPRYIDNFVDASLQGAQDHGLRMTSWAGIEQVGKAAHVPESVPRLVAARRHEVESAVAKAIVRQKALKITNTPSVSVAGTYIVTPEFTSGDTHLFSQLINGLITMTI